MADPKLNEQLLELQEQVNQLKPTDNSQEAILLRRKLKQIQAQVNAQDTAETQKLEEVVITVDAKDDVKTALDGAKQYKEDIKKITPETEKTKIGYEYFGLKMYDTLKPQIERETYYPDLPGGRKSGFIQYRNTYDEDLKKSLGNKKYEEWKKIEAAANKDGVRLDETNINKYLNLADFDEQTKSEVVQQSKSKKSDLILRGYSNKQRNIIEKEIFEGEAKEKAYEEYSNTFNKNLEEYKKTGVANFQQPDYTPIVKELNNEVKKSSEDLDIKFDNFKIKQEKYTNTYKGYEKRIADTEEKIKNFTMSENPTVAEIQKRNALAEEYDNIFKEDLFTNLDNQWQELKALGTEITNESEKLNKASLEVGDINLMSNSLSKNYNRMDRFLHTMEESFLGSAAMLGSSILKGGGDVAAFFASSNKYDARTADWYQDLVDMKGHAVDYNNRLQKYRQNVLPEKLEYGDGGGFDYFAEMMIDNSPSILTAFGTMGYSSLATGAGIARAAAVRQATNAATGVFFTMEAGGQMANLEIAQKEAPKMIAALKNELKNETNLVKRKELEEQISDQENLLKMSQFKKSFNSIAYGGIASLAERFGTLRFINDFQKYSKPLGLTKLEKLGVAKSVARVTSKAFGTTSGVGIGMGIELVEEGATLLGQNFMDIVVLDQNKSLIEGLDGEFVRNTLATSLGISGPSASMNLAAAFNNEVKLRSEARQEGKIRDEVIDIQNELNILDKRTKKAIDLKKRQNKLLAEAAEINSFIPLKLGNMTDAEVQSVFENGKRMRELIAEGKELGQQLEITSYEKQRVEDIKQEIQTLFDVNQETLGKSQKQYLSEIGRDAPNKFEYVVNRGRYDGYKHLIRNMKGINLLATDGKNIDQFLKQSNYTDKQKKDIKNSYNRGSNAVNINDDVITFDDNVGVALSVLSGTDAVIAAVSPLHEVGHIQTRKAGIIKDDKLAAHAKGMVEDIIADVRRRNNIGKLSDSDFQIFNDRINEYKSTDGEVNADELIQLVSDFTAAGILPKSSFGQLYSAKTFINSLLTKFNGEASPFFKINTANDAFNFIASWQQKALTSQTEGAEEETDVVESKDLQSKIAALVPNTVQTQQDFFNRDVFNPIYNNGNLHPLIARYIRSRSISQEQAELNIQNVADRLLNFNPEATRKDGATVGAQGFVEFINSNANFAKLDSAKQLAIEAERRKRTEKIDDTTKQIPAPAPQPKQQEKPTYKTISKSNIFSTSALDQIKNKLVSTVRVLKSKINAPTTINQTVKPIISEIKTEMGKQADIIIKKASGTIKDGRLETTFRKSKKATLENAPTTWLAKAMPFAVQKSVGGKFTDIPILNEKGNIVGYEFKPNFIDDWQGKKIDRVKTTTAGQTSGNQFIKRKPNVAQKVTDEQFMSYMFKFDNDGNATEIIRGRKESWSKMMAEEISFELIDDALNDLTSPIAEELIKNQARLGVEIVENFAQQVRKDIDRGTVKESKGLASFTPEQMDIYTSSKGWADFKNKMAAAEGKYRENIIYRFHKESFLETYPDKLQKEIAKQFFVKLKNYGDVESIKVQLKEDNSSLPEYLEAIRNQIDFNETVKQITGAEASIPVLNDNKVYVADTQQYVIDQAKGEDIKTVVAFFAPTFANSGKIGRERKGIIGKVSRADLFYNQAHVISSLNEAGFNIDKITKKDIILKDGTIIPREFTSTAKVEQKHLDGSLDINKEIEIAGKAWDFMMKLIKNLKNQPSHVRALTLAAMNSGTNTVLRVAAPVLNVSTVLPSKLPSDYRYEHRPPARVVMALSYKSEVLGDKNINIEALKNDYQVSIIPVTMDKVIGKIGLGQSTMPDYKPGITPATNDYYNAFTKNKPGIVSIKNLKTNEIIGKDYEASSKLKNQPTIKEAVAQPKQPKESVVKESKGLNLNKEINNMIARQKGIRAEATYSEIVARKKGASKGALQFFLPATAEDFRGLTSYTFAGRGKQGEADQKFFEDNLVKPYIKGVAAMERARQALKNDYRGLLQMYPEIKKSLNKEIGKTGFTLDQAIRAYLYEKSGNEVPGISKRDLKLLTDTINNNENYKGFADGLLAASKKDSWVEPDPYWDAGSILKDLNDMDQNVNRAEYLQEFIENVDIIFDKQNLNKIEALYGSRHREALEDIIRRMKSGSNRPPGTGDRQTTAWLNWVNNSVGTIMFFNRRSALLQMISFANFTNWSDNNPLMAAKAFANQPAFWKAWVEIFNSDKLKQRRGGLKSDVQEQEIANQAKNSPNKVQAAISYLLKIGFTPTQIADSVAIATGGATFLINRTNTYQKQGMSYEDARAKAFEDFSAISDETQQSGDPMLISKQQAGHLGRFILSFQNTPMQYTRLMKKAGQDLINGRGDWKTNVSKILYYGFVQNLIFAALQNALFALLPEFDPEEEEEAYDKQKNNKYDRIINSMIDTILRGSGLAGAIVSTLKNAIRRYNFEEAKGFTGDHAYTLLELANVSPPIGSKLRKVYGAIQTKRFDQDILDERGLAPDSPAYEIIANLLSAGANIPLDRALAEVKAIAEALDSNNTAMQRMALALGWRTWDVNIRNEEHELIKTQAKAIRKEEGIKKAKETRKRNAELKKEILIKLSKENQKEYIKYLGMSTKDKNEYIKKEIEKLNK